MFQRGTNIKFLEPNTLAIGRRNVSLSPIVQTTNARLCFDVGFIDKYVHPNVSEELFRAIQVSKLCQAKSRQLTCTPSGNECRDAPNVDCTMCDARQRNMPLMTLQVQSAENVLQWKHFCLAIPTGSYGRPSMTADDDVANPHLAISTHLMSTCCPTTFAHHHGAKLGESLLFWPQRSGSSAPFVMIIVFSRFKTNQSDPTA